MFKLSLFVMLSLLAGSAAASPIGLGAGLADCLPPAMFSSAAADLGCELLTVPPAGLGPNVVTGPVYLTQTGLGNGTSIEKGDWTNIYATAFNMPGSFGSSELRVQIVHGTYAVPGPDAYGDAIPKLTSFGLLVLGLLAVWSLNRQSIPKGFRVAQRIWAPHWQHPTQPSAKRRG